MLGVAGAFLALAVGLSVVGCGDDGGIVGGDCAPSYTACELTCVDLARDPSNCGACGVACRPGEVCEQSVCARGRDGSADGAADARDGSPDGALDGGVLDGAFDGTTTPGDGGDGSGGDGGDGDDGGTLDASHDDGPVDTCVPPLNTAQHCGSCTQSCSGATPICYSDDGIYVCIPVCPTNRTLCGSACVDTTTDELNCGACGNVCASAICASSICTGVAPKGHIVTIGHAYGATLEATSQARVLANSAFLSIHNPLRILSYEQYAGSASVSNVESIITQVGTTAGRNVAFTALGNAGDLPQRLTRANVDVLIVHDQRTAPVGGLATIGASWSASLATFLADGGVVIVLDGMAGTTREMNLFLTSSTLLTVPTHTALTVGRPLTVVDPLSSIGAGVVSPYGAGTESASYTSPETQNAATATIVVDPATHEPVVVHKAVF